MKSYLVGGAVRDRLLDLPVRERDWVVTGATAAEMLALGFRPADAHGAFPVFLHPESGEEYALARTEVKAGQGYRGFAVHVGPEVTLEQDLARRDLTINAMAQAADGTLIDPFDGSQDLEKGLLRHVGPAFVEDPLRLLRVARFAARLGRWGFRVAHATHALMCRMAENAEDLRAVAAERVWVETERALTDDQPWRFFEVLHGCGALAVWQPALAAALDDTGDPGKTHCGPTRPPLQALQRAAALTPDPVVRLAALLVAAGISEAIGEAGCRRLKAPGEYGRLVAQAKRHLADLRGASAHDPEALLTLIERLRPRQDPATLDRLLILWQAVEPGAAVAVVRKALDRAMDAAAGVDVEAIKARGIAGAALGAALRGARLEAITSQAG